MVLSITEVLGCSQKILFDDIRLSALDQEGFLNATINSNIWMTTGYRQVLSGTLFHCPILHQFLHTRKRKSGLLTGITKDDPLEPVHCPERVDLPLFL